MNVMSAPFQNGNVLAQNYSQYHREGHFKQITRQSRKGNGHLLGFPSLNGITERAVAIADERVKIRQKSRCVDVITD